MSVFVYHAHDVGLTLVGPLSDHGNLGVSVFFALSGYLVYRPFLRRPVEPVGYMLRRTLRVAPAWLVAVIGVRLLIPAQGPLLVLVMWSLFVELSFYAVLPLLARAARGRELPVVGGLGLASFVLSLVAPSMAVPVAAMPAMLPIFFWCFALGMLLAIVERDRPAFIRSRAWIAGGLPSIGLGLLIADRYPSGYGDPWTDLLVVLGAVVVMGGLIDLRRNWAWTALAADATYSFYLWHYPVMNSLSLVLAPALGVALGFLIAGAISVATTVVLERPIRTFVDLRQRARAERSTASIPVPAFIPVPEY